MATLSVKIANAGAVCSGRSKSEAGHMWISMDKDGAGKIAPISFSGWTIPGANNTSIAKDKVDPYYLSTYYTGTWIIDDKQYDEFYKKLLDLQNNLVKNGIEKEYDESTNSCVDFAWKGLYLIGLNPTDSDGQAFPTWNADEVDEALFTLGLGGSNYRELSSYKGYDVIYGSKGNDTIVAFTDPITKHMTNVIYGGGGSDKITGNNIANGLDGGIGNDTISGGAGNDSLIGGEGHDSLDAGADHDVLWGGIGKDILRGGDGADRFVFKSVDETGKTKNTADIIRDFTRSQGDKIDLSLIDANTSKLFDDSFKNLSSGTKTPATIAAASLFFNTTEQVLYGNVDGTTSAPDFAIELTGVKTLAMADIIA